MRKSMKAIIAVATVFALLQSPMVFSDGGGQKDPHTNLSGGAVICYNQNSVDCGGVGKIKSLK